MNRLYLLLALTTLSGFHANAQTEWIIRDTKNFDYLITLEINGDKLSGKSRAKALIDYMGEAKFNFAKSTTTIKFPEIVHFEGSFDTGSHQKFTGIFNHLFSEIKMEGTLSADTIFIHLFPPGAGQKKTLTGIRNNSGSKRPAYESMVNDIIKITEENIYSTEFIQSKNWSEFKKIILTNSMMMRDNLELQVGFLAIAREFPFTHFNLVKQTQGNQPINNFTLKETDTATCVLDINAFSGSRETMDSFIQIIDAKKYANLIIDLRDNPGGDNESAAPLMEFIFSAETIIGIFPNKKWYTEKNKPPAIEEYKQFNEFRSGTLEQFYKKAANGYGTVLKCVPGKRHFNGRIFVIVNKNTGSTAEIVALALKENKLAILVGQTSSGAALSAKRFNIYKDLDIFIPLNDYISYSGYRIDKKGVKPDIVIKNMEEVKYILQNLLNTESLDKIR